MEPDWLKNYKKRQKERRESQEKSEALAVQQAIESAAYGRPIAPKGACAVALPRGTSAGEQATLTWVAIATGTSPWKAVTAPQQAVTAPQPVEVVREEENAVTKGILTGAKSSPDKRCVMVLLPYLRQIIQ